MILGVLAACLICFAALTHYRANQFTKRAEQNTPPVGQFVNVDGIPVHYVKQGTGPALIMLHGAGGNLKDFSFDLIDRFAKDYTVIAFDRPGHGYTPLPKKSAATLASQSELLRKAAAKLGVTDAYVLGYSYGGALVLHMATNKPEFIRGLVLVSAVSMPWPYPLHLNYRVMSKPIIGPTIMSIATAYFSDQQFIDRYDTVFTPQKAPIGYLDHVGVNMSVRYKNFVENARQLTTLHPQVLAQSKLYQNLSMPIELIHGTADTSVPIQVHAKEFIKLVPHANLVPIEGMGHGAHQLSIKEIEAAVYAITHDNS